MADLNLTPSPSDIDALITSLNDIVFEVDASGKFIQAWADNESRFFVPKSVILNSTIADIFPSDHTALFMSAINDVIANHEPREVEYQSPYSETQYFAGRFQYLRNSDNHVVVSIRDISAAKNAELKLKESEQRFRILIQTSSDVITVLDKDGKIIFDSFSLLTQFGYDTPLTGKTIFDFIHPEDVDFAVSKFKAFQQRPGITEPIEFRFKGGDGVWRHVESIGNNLFDHPAIKGYVINSRDITQRKQMQNVIDDSSNKLKGILESTNDNIFAVDPQYRYTSFNSAHKETIKLLYNTDIQLGQSALIDNNDLSKRDKSAMKKFFDRCLAGERFAVVYEVDNPNIPLSYSEMNFNPIKDERDQVAGVAVFSTDITDKVKAEQDLIKAKNEAIAAANTKSEFLSNMSHEIRTPINAIMGLTELLMAKMTDEEITQYLQSIKYSTDSLLVVINDILDFSKIDAGKISLENIDFNIRDNVAAISKMFKLKSESKGLNFTTAIDPQIPSFIKGDPYRLSQILVNLIGNAIKFTSQGFVSLSVNLQEQTPETIRLVFKIADSGIGIPESQKDLIFESFNQGYTDITRKFGGSGLGLAITQKLTLLQGGKISMQSELNKGSEFTVEIPYSPAATVAPKVAEDKAKNERSLKGKRILIAEDNVMNQFVVKQILLLWNAAYDIAANGLEAVELLKKNHYHLVLMDLQMPEMSGYDATNYIRSKNTDVLNPAIPIIALTADAFMETKRKVLEGGMNDFISKPFTQEELYTKITKHML